MHIAQVSLPKKQKNNNKITICGPLSTVLATVRITKAKFIWGCVLNERSYGIFLARLTHLWLNWAIWENTILLCCQEREQIVAENDTFSC